MTTRFLKNNEGQSLVEVMIALAIGALLMGAAVFAIVFMLRSNTNTQKIQVASVLGRSLIEQARIVADGNWFDVYNLASGTPYYVVASGTTLAFVGGEEGVLENEYSHGVVAHWKFDEATASRYEDSTSNNNDSSPVGPTRVSSCLAAKCVSFDGTNDYASTSDATSLDLQTAVSVSMWIKPTSTDGVVLAAKNDGTDFAWEMALESNKFIGRINASSTYAESSSTITQSTWTHLAMTYSVASGTISVFVNGALSGNASYSTNISLNNVIVSLGRRMSGTPDYYQGFMDEARVYNRKLTPEEVRGIYNSGIFKRYINIDNVLRDSSGVIVDSSGSDDPGSREVSATVEWVAKGTTTSSVSLVDYFTRWKNKIFQQTDWTGGSGYEGPDASPVNLYSSATNIATSSGSIKIQGL